MPPEAIRTSSTWDTIRSTLRHRVDQGAASEAEVESSPHGGSHLPKMLLPWYYSATCGLYEAKWLAITASYRGDLRQNAPKMSSSTTLRASRSPSCCRRPCGKQRLQCRLKSRQSSTAISLTRHFMGKQRGRAHALSKYTIQCLLQARHTATRPPWLTLRYTVSRYLAATRLRRTGLCLLLHSTPSW